MTGYRAYLLDEEGKISQRIDLESETDATALLDASEHIDRHDVEVWHLERLVGKLERSGSMKRSA